MKKTKSKFKKYIGLYESLSMAIIGSVILSFALVMLPTALYFAYLQFDLTCWFMPAVVLLGIISYLVVKAVRAVDMLTMEEEDYYLSFKSKNDGKSNLD